MNKGIISFNVYLFLFLLYSIELFYFIVHFFTNGLFIFYDLNIGSIGIVLLIFLLCIHGLIFFTLLLLSYGIFEKKMWARKFTMFFLTWALLWNLWALLIGSNLIINGILLSIHVLLLLYFTSPSVNYYFSTMFQYGRYTLYTRMVKLKSGMELPIYFFSKNQPKSGIPTHMPDGYIIEENNHSHMPYLLKNKNQAEKNILHKKQKKRNIIYVVKQNHQDDYKWLVRRKHKIISNHKTKLAALRKARQAAIFHHSRILVQNRSGKFHFGFTPKVPKNH